MRPRMLRGAVVAAAAFGLLFSWSSSDHVIRLDAWRQEQIEAAEQELSPQQLAPEPQIAPTDLASPVPTPTLQSTPDPNATPSPTSSATPAPATSETATPTPTPTVIASPSPTPIPVAEGTIGPGGGDLVSADGRLTIEFPANATMENLRIRVTGKDLGTVESVPDHPLLAVWELEAFALERGMAEVSGFNSDVRITTAFTVEDIEGKHPDTLQTWRWDETGESWKPLKSTHVPHSNEVYVEANHFSVYGTTADPAVVSAPFLDAFQADLHTGASQVGVPIQVPPGRGGLTPNVTLRYNSNLVNEMKSTVSHASWAGTGWDLSVGAIRKVAQSGLPDRYFIDVNGLSDELILGSNGWRTKNQQYWSIERLGSDCAPVYTTQAQSTLPVPPCSWIVRDKAGTKYYFGRTGDTGDADPSSARFWDYCYEDQTPNYFRLFYYRWDLRKVVDVHGNTLLYEHEPVTLTDNLGSAVCRNLGEQIWTVSAYPKRILYNFEIGNPFPDHYAEVEFFAAGDRDWTPPNAQGYPPILARRDSPKNFDNPPCGSPQFYADSLKSFETRFLDKVEVKASPSSSSPLLVRRYDLSYSNTDFACIDNKPTAGRLKLESLQTQGNDGSALSSMTFGYGDKEFRLLDPGGGASKTFSRPFLTNATNGFGGSTSYSYVQKNPSVPTGEQRWSREVISERELNEGIAGIIDAMVTQYTYDLGPARFLPVGYQQENEEFRGFGFVKETRVSPQGIVSWVEHDFFTTGGYFNSDEILTGREKEIRFWEFTGKKFWRRVVNTWGYVGAEQPCPPPYGVCASNFVSLEATTTLEGPAISCQQVPTNCVWPNSASVEYDYDARGNLELERQLGEYRTGDERTIWRPYHWAEGTGQPHIFLPKFEHIYHDSYSDWNVLWAHADELPWSCGSSVCLARRGETAFYYDGSNTSALPTQGKLTATGRWYGTQNLYSVYDTHGNKTQQSVPTSGNIISSGSSGAIPSGVQSTTWGYDPFLKIFTTSETNPRGDQTYFDWDFRMASLTGHHDPAGNDVSYTYDVFGRLTGVRDDISAADLGSGVHFVTYEYDWNSSGLSKTTTKRKFGTGASDYTWESHCFDGFGREVQVRTGYLPAAPPLPAQDSVVHKIYDPLGRVGFESAPAMMSHQGTGCTSPTSTGFGTTYEYNGLGEVEKATDNFDNRYTETIRTGLTTVAIDKKLHRDQYTNDAYGRLVQVIEYTGVYPIDVYATTNYSYDTLGNLTRVRDEQGNITSMVYDALGRKSEMTDPDMGHWTYVYDAAGNLKKQQDARGQYVSMGYDVLNRLTGKCYSNVDPCTHAQATVKLWYDSDQLSGACGTPGAATGRLTKMEDQSGTARWCYDVRGRATMERRDVAGAGTHDAKRFYDVQDRPTFLSYIPDALNPGPDSETVRYSYDATSGVPNRLARQISCGGLLCEDTAQGSVYVSNATYDEALRSNQTTFGNGTLTDYNHNVLGQLTHISTPGFQDIGYSYDYAGNLQTISEPGVTVTDFGYDDLDRLVSAGGAYSAYAAGYEYDNVGNLTVINEVPAEIPAVWRLNYSARRPIPHGVRTVDNALNGDLVKAYEYDANGNVVKVYEGANANPLDSDGDGCRNEYEHIIITNSELDCGLRQAGDYWDFFDANHDGIIRVADILVVVGDFFEDEGDATYDPDTDRAPVGPNDWNLKQGDGLHRVEDIIGVIEQFFHDCSPDAPANCNGAPSTPTLTFSYDEENRLSQRTEAGATTTYLYDGQGALVKKIVTGGANPGTTVYVGGIYEKNITSGAITKYYSFGGRRIAMRQGAEPIYLLADKLGSTAKRVSTAGALVDQQTYFPFGKTRTGGVGTDKQFTGHQLEDSDLYFMQARFYDPVVGRFLQPDAIVPDPANPQSLNRYSYVHNNPMRYVDPTGMCPVCLPIIPTTDNTEEMCAYNPAGVELLYGYTCSSGGGGNSGGDSRLRPEPPEGPRTPNRPTRPTPPRVQLPRGPFCSTTFFVKSICWGILPATFTGSARQVIRSIPWECEGVCGATGLPEELVLLYDARLTIEDRESLGDRGKIRGTLTLEIQQEASTLGSFNLLTATLHSNNTEDVRIRASAVGPTGLLASLEGEYPLKAPQPYTLEVSIIPAIEGNFIGRFTTATIFLAPYRPAYQSR